MFKNKIYSNIIMNTFNRDLKMYCLPEFISFYDKCNDRQQTIIEEAMLYNIDICNDMFNSICNQLHRRRTDIMDIFTRFGAHRTWFIEYLPLLEKLDFCTELGLLKILGKVNHDSFYIYSLVDAIKSIQIYKYTLPRSSINNIKNTNERKTICDYIETMQNNYRHVSRLIYNDVCLLQSLLKNCIIHETLIFHIHNYPIVIQYFVLKCIYAIARKDDTAFKEFYNLYVSHVNTLDNDDGYFPINHALNSHNLTLNKLSFTNIPVL